jgi:hypothetical protein
MSHTEAGDENAERPRLDVHEFIGMYEAAVEYLPTEIVEAIDIYVGDRALASDYPHDVTDLYRLMSQHTDARLRAMAASGMDNVVRADRDEGLRLLHELQHDLDERVSRQANETLRDLPRLLGPDSA